jgi:hypothetical protein
MEEENEQMVTAAQLPTLREWFESQVGLGRRFRSVTQMSRTAGLAARTAGDVYDKGYGDATTIIKLAEATGEDPVKLLVIAGILPEDVLHRE